MASDRTYQVTFKVFGNEKIKRVSFHGKMVAPLYIQLIFDRRNTVYKCNLFDLYLKPKYGIRVAGELFPPSLEEVIQREEKLVGFIIDRHLEDFSFEIFKKEYDYYSKDLVHEMELGFLLYLHTFFQDEGMPFLADSLNDGEPKCHLADVVLDMKRALKPELHKRLIDHSFDYAPPYLPLFKFAEKRMKRPLISMFMMDWESDDVKEGFKQFCAKNYPDRNLAEIMLAVERYIMEF